MLPPFTPDGLLPPGDHPLTLEQLEQTYLVTGGDGEAFKNWDCDWRATLVKNLRILVGHLWSVGITEIFIDGSFVEDKDHPNDIDGYFVCSRVEIMSGKLVRDLNTAAGEPIWTWDKFSRRRAAGFMKDQLPMWHKYRCELYPHHGQVSGIPDKFGKAQLFPAAFRKCRSRDIEKGIVRLLKSGVQT